MQSPALRVEREIGEDQPALSRLVLGDQARQPPQHPGKVGHLLVAELCPDPLDLLQNPLAVPAYPMEELLELLVVLAKHQQPEVRDQMSLQSHPAHAELLPGRLEGAGGGELFDVDQSGAQLAVLGLELPPDLIPDGRAFRRHAPRQASVNDLGQGPCQMSNDPCRR